MIDQREKLHGQPDARPWIIETYADRAGEFRWRLLAANGEIVADGGEGYTRGHERDEAVQRVFEAFARGVTVRAASG